MVSETGWFCYNFATESNDFRWCLFWYTPTCPWSPNEKKHRIWMGTGHLYANPRSCFLGVVFETSCGLAPSNFQSEVEVWTHQPWTNPITLSNFAKNNIQKCQKSVLFQTFQLWFLTISTDGAVRSPSSFRAGTFSKPNDSRYPWWKAQGCYLADTKKLKLAGWFLLRFFSGGGHIERTWSNDQTRMIGENG